MASTVFGRVDDIMNHFFWTLSFVQFDFHAINATMSLWNQFINNIQLTFILIVLFCCVSSVPALVSISLMRKFKQSHDLYLSNGKQTLAQLFFFFFSSTSTTYHRLINVRSPLLVLTFQRSAKQTDVSNYIKCVKLSSQHKVCNFNFLPTYNHRMAIGCVRCRYRFCWHAKHFSYHSVFTFSMRCDFSVTWTENQWTLSTVFNQRSWWKLPLMTGALRWQSWI